jgi:hypothetical protein
MLRFVVGALILTLAVGLGGILIRRAKIAPRQVAVPSSAGPTAEALVPASPPGPSEGATATPEASGPARENPLSEALCPPDMVLIDTSSCPAVRHRCLERDASGACRKFASPGRCKGASRPVAFCVDRFEYPNVPNALPAMLLTFEDAEAACRHERKRLCTDQEWTIACEGPEHAPYPQGFAPGPEACNVGPALRKVPVEKIWDARHLAAVVDEFDRRAPAGAYRQCTSGFGIGDLAGNVSEWVKTSSGHGSERALKGGDFTTGAVDCRAVTAIRAAHYAAFAVGARCCADPLVKLPASR